jgi:predicted nucleic acid-binding protein
MKPPTDILVVDTNIILSALLRPNSQAHLERLASRRELVFTDASLFELRVVIARVPKFNEAILQPTKLLDLMTQVSADVYAELLAPAKASLQYAPASKNGSSRDAHILACAWVHDADIWSHDRDFAGTGWPNWSTTNLFAALTD